jgi:hypothetical protein
MDEPAEVFLLCGTVLEIEMPNPEILIQAAGTLSLVLWLTTRAFRLGPVANRRVLMSAFVALGVALAVAIIMTVRYFWR